MKYAHSCSEGFFCNGRDQNLLYRSWLSQTTAEAAIIIVHGVGEHSGRYDEVACFLSAHAYNVYAFDLPGHGKSAGKQGHIDRFEDFADDLLSFYNFLKQDIEGRPVFVIGHSLGALVTIRAVRNHSLQLKGVVLSGPPFKLNFLAAPWYEQISRVFARVIPSLCIKERSIRLNMLTHDEQKIAEFRADPYRHYHRSLRFIREYFKAEKNAFNDAPLINYPLLIVQGSADDVVDVSMVRKFHSNVGVEDKTLILYPGMYHEVFNEIERQRVFDDMLRWMWKQRNS